MYAGCTRGAFILSMENKGEGGFCGSLLIYELVTEHSL